MPFVCRWVFNDDLVSNASSALLEGGGPSTRSQPRAWQELALALLGWQRLAQGPRLPPGAAEVAFLSSKEKLGIPPSCW